MVREKAKKGGAMMADEKGSRHTLCEVFETRERCMSKTYLLKIRT